MESCTGVWWGDVALAVFFGLWGIGFLVAGLASKRHS